MTELNWEEITAMIAAGGVVITAFAKCIYAYYKGEKIQIKTIKIIYKGIMLIYNKIKIWKKKK